jgi:mono/diheme cytochrome c family protein
MEIWTMKTHLILVLATLALANGAYADDQANAGRTILQQRCYKCHGDGGHFSGKFNLDDSVQTMVDKGILVYGDPEHSLLYQKVRDQDMPADGNYLNSSELGLVSTWIQSLKPADVAPTEDALAMSDDQVFVVIE